MKKSIRFKYFNIFLMLLGRDQSYYFLKAGLFK